MRNLFVCLLSLLGLVLYSQTTVSTFGPIQLSAQLSSNQQFQYSVRYKNKTIVFPSSIGFQLYKPALRLNRFRITGIDSAVSNSSWKPVWGEQDEINDHHKEIRFHLVSTDASAIRLDLIFRLFEDGIGFRYAFPDQPALKHFIVQQELTAIKLRKDHTAFWIPGDFDTNEFLYNKTALSKVDAFAAAAKEKDIAVTAPAGKQVVQTPLMLKSADGIYINIHEAALLNYPVMQLQINQQDFSLHTVLVPDAVGHAAYLQTPFQTPWRTITVSDDARNMLASKMILNLNEPSVIKETDWIKPQKFIGMWWEMHVGKANWPMRAGKHGANTENVKRYIDFAATHQFNAVLVEGWNEGWEDWFGNWKENVFDFVTPYPDYNIKWLSDYAKEKNVRLIMHHETSGAVTNYERRLDTAYRFMKQHNINTVKTGYVGKIIPRGEHHDGQWMINHYNRVAATTAQYQLMLAAHESARPTGLHRTYPNWLANEAARGTEFNNAPTLGIPPEHQTILPFTRLMGGPMDYTPGLFHFNLNQFEPDRKQRVLSTLAKQLALYITIYSPLQMAADLPENYEKHLDAFQFIKDVPVDWSETKILEAEPGDYIIIARREKGKNNWFLGAITDEKARSFELTFNFLPAGKKYMATIYKDGQDADYEKNPASYTIEKREVSASTVLPITMARGGGCAISIMEVK
ncbi:MAG: glycoside hydrolase family 97 protein [Bacteroidota bacterium]